MRGDMSDGYYYARSGGRFMLHSGFVSDALERDIMDMLRRISRLPVEPTLDSELLADLGFDSLLVLELVGEIEEQFAITVPLDDLNRIRTVRQVLAEVRGLVSARGEGA